MKLVHPAHLRELVDRHRSALLANFIRAPGKIEAVTGYLVEISPEWLVIEELNWECFRLNGVCLIPCSTITRVQLFEEQDWPSIAARRLRIPRRLPMITSTRSLQELLQAYQGKTSIIEIEEATTCPDQIFLGEIMGFSSSQIRIKSYDRSLKALNAEFALSEVTKLTMRHGYARAIEMVLRERRKRREGNRKK